MERKGKGLSIDLQELESLESLWRDKYGYHQLCMIYSKKVGKM